MRELKKSELMKVSGGSGLGGIVKAGWALGKALGKAAVKIEKLDTKKPVTGSGGSQASQGSGFGSDRRLKHSIRAEGKIESLDLAVYSWEYHSLPGERFVGVMAQELLARPDLSDAVFTFESGIFKGFYGVNYDSLGLRCVPQEDFNGDVNTLQIQKLQTA